MRLCSRVFAGELRDGTRGRRRPARDRRAPERRRVRLRHRERVQVSSESLPLTQTLILISLICTNFCQFILAVADKKLMFHTPKSLEIQIYLSALLDHQPTTVVGYSSW